MNSVKANEYKIGTNLSFLVTTNTLKITSQQVTGFFGHCPEYSFCLFGDVARPLWKTLGFVFKKTLCSLLKAHTNVDRFP